MTVEPTRDHRGSKNKLQLITTIKRWEIYSKTVIINIIL